MTETKHGVDASFNDRLNILRAGVLGANDGIISIAGVVIGVASATSNLWIIFLSGLSAILAGAFSMAGGEYVSVSTQKDTEEAAVNREQALLDRDPKAARDSLYVAYLQNGECDTAAQIMTERAFLKHPLNALVEEKYGWSLRVYQSLACGYLELCCFCPRLSSSYAVHPSLSQGNPHSRNSLSSLPFLLYRLHQCQARKSPNQTSHDP